MLAQGNIYEATLRLQSVSVAAQGIENIPQTRNRIKWANVFESIMRPIPNSENLLYSEKETSALNEQQAQEEIKMQQMLNNPEKQ